MTELDIQDLKFNYSEIGDMIKASKGLYSWEFVLDGKRHKIDLTHSRIKGKRVIVCDGDEINSCLKYTYNYTYSFPLDGHYYTVIQISPDQYDLRIDNISYMILKNKSKRKKENEKIKKIIMMITSLMMRENLILEKIIIKIITLSVILLMILTSEIMIIMIKGKKIKKRKIIKMKKILIITQIMQIIIIMLIY